MDNQYRELTARELQAIRRLVTSKRANFDHEYAAKQKLKAQEQKDSGSDRSA